MVVRSDRLDRLEWQLVQAATALWCAFQPVRALITLEPSGAPDPAKADAAKLKGVPHLIVWGDFLDRVPVWQKLVVNPTRWGQAIAAAGGKVDTFELPRMGIKGNTHMMMMDRNSDDVAKLVNDWIEKQGLVN